MTGAMNQISHAIADLFKKIKNRGFGSDRDINSVELDDQWDEVLDELRERVQDEGFSLEENEELYMHIVTQIVKENEEGLQKLADEEVAERSMMGEDTSIDESASVKIKTISPQSDK